MQGVGSTSKTNHILTGVNDMKCDDCKNMVGEMASQECPWPTVWCAAGHWEGMGTKQDDNSCVRCWDECKDYDQIKESEVFEAVYDDPLNLGDAK